MRFRALSDREIKSLLEECWHGVLALVDGERPYCFPTAHVFCRGSLYFLFLRYGRKIRCIERNPNACYLVLNMSSHSWFSIVVEGVLTRVDSATEVREVLEMFASRVFPRDPYFSELVEVPGITARLLEEHMSGRIPGVYRMSLSNISGIAYP